MLLKPSCLLHFFQDLATISAEELGFGYSFVVQKNLAWFLLKYRIEFINYPEKLYDIDIKTTPRGYNKLFAYRDFEIEHNDKIIAKATSTWALVDIDTKSMVSVAQALSDNPHMKQFEKQEDDLSYEKIKPLENITKEKTFEIRFDDLDVNKHVNNVNYIIWAFETLDFDFRNSKKLKSLDIMFKKEIKFGASILSLVEIKDNLVNHVLKNKETNEELCLIQAQWIDR